MSRLEEPQGTDSTETVAFTVTPEMTQPSDDGRPHRRGGPHSPVPVKPDRARNKTTEALAELASSIHALRRDLTGIHQDIRGARSDVSKVNRKQLITQVSLQSLFNVYNILFTASQHHAADSRAATPDRTSELADTLMQVIEADLCIFNIKVIKPVNGDIVDRNEMEVVGVEAGAPGWLGPSSGVVMVEACGFKTTAPEQPQVLSRARVIVQR